MDPTPHDPPPEEPTPQEGGLQFDRAEPAARRRTSLQCAACLKPIGDLYFTVGTQTVCDACRTEAEAAWRAGSPVQRFFNATILGVLAAAVGAGIYYAISAVTGYELGIIAIVVGLLVGSAVKKGTGGRGGRVYQLLAAFLTYCAIVTTYLPLAYKARAEGAGKGKAEAAAKGETPAPEPSRPKEGAGAVLLHGAIALAILFAVAFAVPVLAGFENFMGWIIIGIALYEAWVINRPVHLEFAGPFRVGPAGEVAGA